ncbi:MAG: hypothetical protein ACYSUK_11755 [Planctomycetota bacterium]|jgi:hypothetical protein
MMFIFPILAQAVETAETTPLGSSSSIVPVDLIWEYITNIDLLEALTFISFGIVCLFYGWRVFKILVCICFGLIGIFVGIKINVLFVGGNGFWLGIIFMVLFAVCSVPFVRWGVSLLGALSGAVITGGLWHAMSLPDQYIWAGAIVGLIAGGMISFIVFKAAVMLFTCLGGSSLMVVGMLAVMYLYMGTREEIRLYVFEYKWFMPVLIVVPMAIGMLAQWWLIKKTKEWDI